MSRLIVIISAADGPADPQPPRGGPALDYDNVTFQGDVESEQVAIDAAWKLWDQTFEARPEWYILQVTPG